LQISLAALGAGNTPAEKAVAAPLAVRGNSAEVVDRGSRTVNEWRNFPGFQSGWPSPTYDGTTKRALAADYTRDRSLKRFHDFFGPFAFQIFRASLLHLL
jgi:hypothetical protein